MSAGAGRHSGRGIWFTAAAGVIAAAVIVAGWWCFEATAVAENSRRELSLLTAVVVAFVVPACVGRVRRPQDRQPVRLAVAGIVIAVSYLRLVSQPWAATIGALAWYATPLALVDALVGRRSRPARARHARLLLVGLATVAVTTAGPRTSADPEDANRAASWIFFDERVGQWSRQANPLGVLASDAATTTVFVAWTLVLLGAAAAVLRARPRGGRRWWEPAVVTTWVGTTAVLALPRRFDGGPGPIADAWFGSLVTALPAMLAAVVGGVAVWDELVQPRLNRAADGTLELPPSGSVTSLPADVARSLGDPSARILFPVDDRWVDADGHDDEIDTRDGRATVVVGRRDRLVAAIEHDATLLDQLDLVDVTATTAALRLDAAVLTAEAEAAAADARASAARMLTSADRAGRELQATLASGPDAALAALAARLEERPLPLAEIHDGLRATLAEVRAISHGVAPPALQRHGLVSALDQLWEETGTAVDVEGLGDGRLPGSVELTTYLVVEAAAGCADDPVAATVSREGEQVVVRVHTAGTATETLGQRVLDRVEALGGTVGRQDGELLVEVPIATEEG